MRVQGRPQDKRLALTIREISPVKPREKTIKGYMLQHSYKQLEEAYQREVNKEHKPNPARTHPMSSRQGKEHPEMPITQTEPAQYSQDSQSDSDQDFDITTVNPNAESTRLDGAHSHPQDSHAPHHTKLKADNMNQHGHQGASGDLQGPSTKGCMKHVK